MRNLVFVGLENEVGSGGIAPAYAAVLGAAFVTMAAHEKAEDLLARLPPGARPVIDGACLDALAPVGSELAARDAAALIHEPPARQRPVLQKLGRVITTGPAIAARLVAEYGIGAGAVAVVRPGTPDFPRQAIDDARPEGSPCAVLAVGVIAPRKGHDLLVRALAGLPDLDWYLTIAGDLRDPDHRIALAALIAELGVGHRVRILESPSAAQWPRIWEAADLFALASSFEPFPFALAQALRRGLPVALSAEAAVDLAPAEAGGIVARADPDFLVQYGRALRRLVFSPRLRGICGAASHAAGRALPGWEDAAQALVAALGREERSFL